MKVLAKEVDRQGRKAETISPAKIDTPEEVKFLFATRFAIERELRRIAANRQIAPANRPVPAFRLTRALVEAGLMEARLEHAIREVYAVCSPAIHGEPVTEAQLNFVRDIGSELIAALQSIE